MIEAAASRTEPQSTAPVLGDCNDTLVADTGGVIGIVHPTTHRIAVVSEKPCGSGAVPHVSISVLQNGGYLAQLTSSQVIEPQIRGRLEWDWKPIGFLLAECRHGRQQSDENENGEASRYEHNWVI
jgi:hypothetical protein